jgi:hypothetical protein
VKNFSCRRLGFVKHPRVGLSGFMIHVTHFN